MHVYDYKKKYPNYRVYSNRTRLYDLLIDDDVFHLKQSVGGFNDIQCRYYFVVFISFPSLCPVITIAANFTD